MILSPRRFWSSPFVRLICLAILFGGTALVTACPDSGDDRGSAGCTCYDAAETARVDVPSATNQAACLQAQQSNENFFECEWNSTPVTPSSGARPGFVSPE